MHFRIALSNQKDDPAIPQLEKMLSDWRSISTDQQKIVSNLYAEHFAPVSEMEALIREMKQCLSASPSDFRLTVINKYKAFAFSGDRAVLPSTVSVLGFSLTRYALKDVLKTYYPEVFEDNEKKMDAFLDIKAVGRPAPAYREEELFVKGPEATIWITWSKTSDNPFDFMKYGYQEEIYNALALSNYYKTGDIFVFLVPNAFPPPSDNMWRPTVFDAGDYPPFLPPAAAFKEHGLTDPHNHPSLVVNGVRLTHDQRPEAIVKGNLISWQSLTEYRQYVNNRP